eukprot:11190829-Lingulodinium_polyedra.AAC.1
MSRLRQTDTAVDMMAYLDRAVVSPTMSKVCFLAGWQDFLPRARFFLEAIQVLIANALMEDTQRA